jgi:WD40 repeat protein
VIPVIVGTVPRRYTVFLSYRHADNKEQGRQWATWLHQMLESYEVPPDLVGTPNSRGEPIPASLYPVFRDEEELSADADLTSRIREALENSTLVVVLCSPRSVASRFVADEIRYFKELGAADRILALLIDGAPHAPTDPTKPSSGADADLECLPEPLRFGMARPDGSMDWAVPAEPIAADARPRGEPVQGWTTAAAYREQLEREALLDRAAIDREVREYEQRLDRARLKIIAGALAVPLGTLTKRDKSMQLAKQRERLRILRRWLMAVAVLAVLATAGGLLAWVKQREATEQSERRRLLLAEAARSDRLAAEDKLGTDEAPGAFAYLGRALSYDPSSALSAEKAVVALNGWRFPPPMAIYQGHANWVTSARFSADGERLVTASGDKTARLWETRSGKLIGILEGHQNAVNTAEFSPDGRHIVTASVDGTARVWDAQTGKVLANLDGHHITVHTAEFSSDGKRVLIASVDGTAQVWDVQSGKVLVTLKGHAGDVYTAKFSPDGRRIVTASSDKDARVWDAQSGQTLAILKGHENTVGMAQFSPDGTRIVTASWDRTSRVWAAENGKPLVTLKGHTNHVESAQFSPDGKWIVTASNDTTARLWDAQTGRERVALNGHAGWVHSAWFSANGDRIVTASSDSTARIWDAATGQPLFDLSPHPGSVWYGEFSADGKLILTGDDAGTARLWDGTTGLPLTGWVKNGVSLKRTHLSPDGRWALSAAEDGSVRVWPLLYSPPPAPGWLPELAEALAGRRLRDDGTLQQVPPERWFALNKSLGASTSDDLYARWAKWFFVERVKDKPSLFVP